MRAFSFYALLSTMAFAGALGRAQSGLAQAEYEVEPAPETSEPAVSEPAAPVEELAPEPAPAPRQVVLAPSEVVQELTPDAAAEPEHEKRERPSFVFAYEMALAVKDYHRFVGNPTFRAWGFAMEWPVFKGLRVGAAFDYTRFHDIKPRRTYYAEDGAVTAKVYNYSDAWAVGAVARYRFGEPGARFRPYLGTEVGATFISATQLIADLGYQELPMGFLFVADAGGIVHVTDRMFGLVGLRYNLTTAAFGRVSNPSFVTLQLGLGWD